MGYIFRPVDLGEGVMRSNPHHWTWKYAAGDRVLFATKSQAGRFKGLPADPVPATILERNGLGTMLLKSYFITLDRNPADKVLAFEGELVPLAPSTKTN